MKRRSFSLIEIIMVMLIIGVLSSIALSITQSTKVRSRDTKRKTDLQTVKVAVELFRSANGYYPTDPAGFEGAYVIASCADYTPGSKSLWDSIELKMKPFIAKLPLDPIGNGQCVGTAPYHNDSAKPGHMYSYFSSWKYTYPPDPRCPGCIPVTTANGVVYAMWAALESPRDPDRNGTADLNGKYKNIFSYLYNVVIGPTDNLQNTYVVGCHYSTLPTWDGFTDTSWTMPCYP